MVVEINEILGSGGFTGDFLPVPPVCKRFFQPARFGINSWEPRPVVSRPNRRVEHLLREPARFHFHHQIKF
jgi:hypothetical protein